jgi:hypothetical protein
MSMFRRSSVRKELLNTAMMKQLLYPCYNNCADFEIGTHSMPNLHPGKKATLCTANPKFDKLTTRIERR